MTKLRIFGLVSLVAAGALVTASFVNADTTQLAVTCSANLSMNVITWTANATGGTSPYAYAWTGTNVGGSTSSVVVATYTATGTYQAGIQVTDSASSTATATSTCFATVTALPNNSTTTPTSTNPGPHSFVNKPTLAIEGNGRFMARGMVITSVGSGTFQGQIWGITYTVNLLNSPEFFYRYGKLLNSTSSAHLSVGDEVGVAGQVSTSSPLVVNAAVVRDYNINVPNPPKKLPPGILKKLDDSSISSDAQGRLNDLLEKLRGLQDLFNKKQSGDH